ncbi:hypothetical protein ACH4TX_04665 [Streptomyces sp. NPDC021098]|uniref:hypothetical protein n=1 Tax=unclassified Streptomyces TaxID=2593676 RepID=UPI0037917153
MRQKRKLAIAMTVAALATAMGTSAAATEPQPENDNTSQSARSDDTSQSGRNDDTSQSGRTGRENHNGYEKSKGCVDVDSAGNEGVIAAGVGAKYISTVCNGQVYVLSVDESTNPGTPVGGWQSVGGPRDVLEATLASNTDDVQGGPLFVTVLTKSQEVWEGRCPNTRPVGTCVFTQLPDPPH